ncbi:MAG: hypothetical protein H7315_06825 [Herminiimonas sp.]|nr:hypothetical protein [Herminiimonas sp.]
MMTIQQSQNPLQVGSHVYGQDGGDTIITKDNVNNFVLEPGDIVSSTDGTIAKVKADGNEEIYADGRGLTADKSDDVATIAATPNGFKEMWKKLLDGVDPEQEKSLLAFLYQIRKYFFGEDANVPTDTSGKPEPVGGTGKPPVQLAKKDAPAGSGTGNGSTGGNAAGGGPAGGDTKGAGSGDGMTGAGPGGGFKANATGAPGDDTANTSLKEHVESILADGNNHGFEDGYATFLERIGPAMDSLRKKGIVTSDDPYEAMQQASDWLMANSGTDKVFSFGGGPNGENDAEKLSKSSHVSIEDINTIKFMFDSHHDAELNNKDAFLNVQKGIKVFDELAKLI